jgi:GTP cyclohydrolase II
MSPSQTALHLFSGGSEEATKPVAVRRVASTSMPTRWGVFEADGYERAGANGKTETALVISLGDLNGQRGCCASVRSASPAKSSGRFAAIAAISWHWPCKPADEGCGLVIYEYQEGSGIGLMAKLRAYEMQDAGLDRIEANQALGFVADCRDYSLPIAISRALEINRVRLLSNSPDKPRALSRAGVEIVARLACEAAPNPYSLAYLRTKKERLGHELALEQIKDHGAFTGSRR